MTPLVHFFVEGQPIPKARWRSGAGGAYTPQATVNWANQVGWTAVSQWRPRDPVIEDVAVTLTFFRRGRQRADLDNLVKNVWDALNGIVYQDDRQIVRAVNEVLYDHEEPGVWITVELIQHGD
jgi:Holliday junction resolvase RusA-like endonuclease